MKTALPGEINHPMFDRYSLVHLLKGMFARASGRDFSRTLSIAVLWEVAERPLKEHYPDLFPHATQDTLANMFGDVISTTSGWILANYLYGEKHGRSKKSSSKKGKASRRPR